jgi:RNA polymerase sigma-70 factor (ECF subfamily)
MIWTEVDARKLFAACADNRSVEAWNEFIRRYGDLIARTVVRVARRFDAAAPEVVEDLIQDTYLKLCQRGGQILRQWRGPHEKADYGFIKVFTANVVVDHFRALNAQSRGSSATVPLASVEDTAGAESAPERTLILREIEDCLQRNSGGRNPDRDRWVFSLYYRYGFSAHAIAQLPEIELTPEGVESLLVRLRRMLRSKLSDGADTPPKASQAV